MDFSRQMELYDTNDRKDNVEIIGVGATGSWVALMLSKLGVKSIGLFDMDIVETHNIPNQVYGIDDGGMFKVKACEQYLEDLGSRVSNIYTNVTEITKDNIGIFDLGETIFCLVDSMKARKELFEAMLETDRSKLWIETRMGLTGYRIYMIHLDNENEVNKYRETLYSDDEAEVSACGASKSIVTTAMQCASHAVGLWLAEINGAEYIPNEIIFDVHSSFIMSRKFDKPKD